MAVSNGTVNTSLTVWEAPGASSFVEELRLLPASLGILGATLVMIALSANSSDKVKSSVDTLHINMALADFLDSLNYPLNLSIHSLMRMLQIAMTPTLCIAEVSFSQVFSSASLLSTAFLSVDRYRAIKRGATIPTNGFAHRVIVCFTVLSYIVPGLVFLLPTVLPSEMSSLKPLDALCGYRKAFEICDLLCLLLNVLSLSVTVGVTLSTRLILKQKLLLPRTAATLLSDALVKEELRLHILLILQACVSLPAVATDFLRVSHLVIFSNEMIIEPGLMFIYEFESALNAVLVFGLLPKFRTHLKTALRFRTTTNRVTYIDSTDEL
uniref:G-protein coupled receptors family 1 profile domain-containing protein n=1 Tax=Plectus sambesii TaxID=2011161 RepID=A0A914UUM6_9BILA